MEDKCEWKSNKHIPCENLSRFLNNISQGILMYEISEKERKKLTHSVTLYGQSFENCPFCAVNLRVPEPEKLLIVESGKTQVAHWKGIDYLYMLDPHWTVKNYAEDFEMWRDHWKSFTGDNPDITELTDEIALLRPMVWSEPTANRTRLLDKLIWCENGNLRTVQGWNENCRFRLATAKELQEAQK